MRGQVSHTFLILFHVMVLAMVLGFLMFHATRTDTGFIQRSFRASHLGQSITALSFWPNQADYSFYSASDREYKGWSDYQTQITSLEVLSYNPESNADPLKTPYASKVDNQFNSDRFDPQIAPITILKGHRMQISSRTIECESSNQTSNLILHPLFGGVKDQFYDINGDIVTDDPTIILDGFKEKYFIDEQQVYKANPGKTRGSQTDAQILMQLTQGAKRSYEQGDYIQIYNEQNALITITDSKKEYVVIKTPDEHYSKACNTFNSLISDEELTKVIDGGTIMPSDEFTIEFQVPQNSRLLSKSSIIAQHLAKQFGDEE